MDDCATGTAALKDLLEADLNFARRAPDSLGAGRLQWYVSMAHLAGSLDLGITTGPWIHTAEAAGAAVHGHFLTVWKRDADCRWRVEFDTGVSHAESAAPEPKLDVDEAVLVKDDAPPHLIAADAAGVLRAFQDTVEQDGVAAGLRTYACTADFRYFTDTQAPMGLGAANRYLTAKDVLGTCQESAQGRSTDGSVVYGAGLLRVGRREVSHNYVQVWQYDPRVANLGLRILLINPAPPPMSK